MTISKETKNKIIWACIYFVAVIAIVIAGSFIFTKSYFQTFWVEGYSMSPTINYKLDNKHYEFGLSDQSNSARSNTQRYDIVITQYPEEWKVKDTSSKIKRVWGLPNETITLKDDGSFVVETLNSNSNYETEFEIKPVIDGDYYVYKTTQKTFRITKTNRTFSRYTLKDNEYFLMGDNWAGSSDSYEYNIKNHFTSNVLFSDLVGVVVSLQGTCTITYDGTNPVLEKTFYSKESYFI